MFRNKSSLKFLLKLVFALALLSLLLYKSNIHLIFNNFLALSLVTIIITIVISYFSLIINSLKWRILLPGYKFFNLFKITLIGQFFNTLLPGQVAGEAAKAYLLGKGNNDFNKIIASVIVDKITGTIGLLMVGLAGLFFTEQRIPVAFSISIIAGFLMVIIVMFSIRLNIFYNLILNIFKKTGKRFKKMEKYFIHLIEIIDSWKYYSGKKRLLFQSIIYGILYQLSGVLIIYFLASGFHISISFIDWFWILAILSVILLLPVSIGGVGVREGTLIGILGFSGVGRESAMTLSFALYGLQLLLALTGGIIYSGMPAGKKNDPQDKK